LENSTVSIEKQREEKRRIIRGKLKQGLAGQRFGRHVVQKAKIDVQLGEDLADSLRSLKVSGSSTLRSKRSDTMLSRIAGG
jgi:hypothetical protein